MLAVSAISPQTPSAQPEHHPGAAIASLIIPGTGQFIKGDVKEGLIDTGIWAGLMASHSWLKKRRLNSVKANLAWWFITLWGIGHHLHSAVAAYLPKGQEPDGLLLNILV